MADTTTALDVLDGIAQDLGGTGGYDTLVPVLQEIRELLAAGVTPADGSITTAMMADGAVTREKLADDCLIPMIAAASVEAAQVLALFDIDAEQIVPKDIDLTTPILTDVRFRLAWLSGAELDSSIVYYSANTQGGAVTLFARGRISQCAGVMGVDDSWTITSL